jgi:hypothetical protein
MARQARHPANLRHAGTGVDAGFALRAMPFVFFLGVETLDEFPDPTILEMPSVMLAGPETLPGITRRSGFNQEVRQGAGKPKLPVERPHGHDDGLAGGDGVTDLRERPEAFPGIHPGEDRVGPVNCVA